MTYDTKKKHPVTLNIFKNRNISSISTDGLDCHFSGQNIRTKLNEIKLIRVTTCKNTDLFTNLINCCRIQVLLPLV